MNNAEVKDRVFPEDKKRGRNCELSIFKGGHSWGPAELHEKAILWHDSLWSKK